MRRTALVFTVLLVVAAGGLIVYQAARERDYRALVARGDTALAADQTFGAIEAYSGAIALQPGSMLSHLRRAEAYERRGELEAAARDFRTAAALDPTALRPLDELGDVLFRLNRFARAADSYDAYLVLDDRPAAVHYKLAMARYRAGDIAASIAALERTVSIDDTSADAYYLLGVCLQDAGRGPDAVAAFERAVALAPTLIPAREELADAYAALGRPTDELEQLQLLAGLDREHVERQVAVSLAHARAGDMDLAVLALSNALERTSGPPILYEALGRVWLDIAQSRGDRVALGKAIAALSRVASSPAASSDALMLYGEALARDGQAEVAERMLQQAAAREPIAPAALQAYATAAEQAGHLDEAREALIEYRALASEGDDVEALAHIADLSARLDDPQDAARWFGRALQLSPADVRLMAGLAAARLALGQRDEARAMVQRGLDHAPDDLRLLTLAERLR